MKYIELTRGKRAMVDDEDYEELSKYRWYARNGGNTYYAVRHYLINRKQHTMHMHRVIMDTPSNMDTDHINHNGLDNRRSNLRICTRSENLINRGVRSDNTSGYKGVYFRRDMKKWTAQIQVAGKTTNVGYFETPELAHVSYAAACIKCHGEFANTN